VEERREELSGFQSERLILMKSITLADIDDLSIVRMNAENFKLNLEDGYQKFLDVSTSYSVRLSQRNKGQEQEKERQRLSGLLKEEEILISEKEVELVGVHNQLTIIQEKICRAFQLTSSEQIDMEWREKKHILEKDLQEKKTKKTLLEQEQRQEKIRIYELEEERVKESAEGAKLEEGSRSLGIELEALFSDLREGPVSMFPPDCSLEECVQICTSEREEIVQSEIRIQTEYAGNKKRIFLYEENTEAINDLAILEAQEEGWQRIRKALNLGVTFREFAQVLQLQNLIDRANVQLQQILNGYHLSILTTEDGHPVLDFNISKEGEKERPITTLSGGESFSIALAFALALGNLRKIHMPIQTLLIDEGFGNLDHQSADMVVSGLEALKKRNIQVGIISHVLPLQERIAARVSVSDLKISDVKTTPPEFKEKKKGSTKKKSLDKAET
jgi:exonuclease SbcC